MCVSLPWWGQFLLQELLYLVDINLDLAIKGHKRRVGSWGKVLQVSRLPDNSKKDKKTAVRMKLISLVVFTKLFPV